MSLLKRMRRRREEDQELESKARIDRNAPRSHSREDIEHMTEELVPWYRTYRAKQRRGE